MLQPRPRQRSRKTALDTSFTTLPTDLITERIAVAVARIGSALRHHAWQGATTLNITPTQGQILSALNLRPGATLSELARELGTTAATASDAVTALSGKGLLEKSRRPEDQRALWLTLTSAGKSLADQTAAWPDFLAEAVGELEVEERKILLRTLISLMRQLHQAGHLPVARLCVTCRFFEAHTTQTPDRPHFCTLLQASLAETDLRIDCPEQDPAAPEAAESQWRRWRGEES